MKIEGKAFPVTDEIRAYLTKQGEKMGYPSALASKEVLHVGRVWGNGFALCGANGVVNNIPQDLVERAIMSITSEES